MSCTGYAAEYLPPGPERDECLGLIRIGVKFAAQHTGRKHGFLHNYLLGLARGMGGELSFERLLLRLRHEALKRELLGDEASPVEEIDEGFKMLAYYDPRLGRRQITLCTLRNKWSKVREIFSVDTIPASPKP
jgi:hypothetical protein